MFQLSTSPILTYVPTIHYVAYEELSSFFCSLSGGELFDRIADENYKMSESEVIKYIRQVCEGLRYMHELSYVHLDIKVSI